jgi:hypothetical protein
MAACLVPVTIDENNDEPGSPKRGDGLIASAAADIVDHYAGTYYCGYHAADSDKPLLWLRLIESGKLHYRAPLERPRQAYSWCQVRELRVRAFQVSRCGECGRRQLLRTRLSS